MRPEVVLGDEMKASLVTSYRLALVKGVGKLKEQKTFELEIAVIDATNMVIAVLTVSKSQFHACHWACQF